MAKSDGQKLLFMLVVFNILLHLLTVPWWVILWSTACLAWWALNSVGWVSLPGKVLKAFIVILGVISVFVRFGTFLGPDPSTSLLVLMVSFKLFEMKNYKDVMMVTFYCFLLVAFKLIDSQSLIMTLILVIDVLLIISLLAFHHSPSGSDRLRGLWKRSVRVGLQALPLVLVLFVLFPRFNSSFVKPVPSQVNKSGFSEDLNPGDVSEVAASDKVAFRVTFHGGFVPPVPSRYWRGGVLTTSKGLEWKKAENSLPIRAVDQKASARNGSVIHDIYLEPTQNKWMFALDWPVAVSFLKGNTYNRIEELPGRIFKARKNLVQRAFYRSYSQPFAVDLDYRSEDLVPYLALEVFEAPETEALAKKLSEGAASSHEKAERILKYLQSEGYKYDLKPGKVSGLDEFLFRKKVGFCEHYAAAVGTLLRMMKVPSRVVIGFQGGTPSLMGDYYIIRYLDAHAWVEYFSSEDNRWKRLDPVQVVEPSRIELGGAGYRDAFLANKEGNGEGIFESGRFVRTWLAKNALQLELLWDRTELAWADFLIHYDYSFQESLMKELGWKRVSWWMMLGLMVLAVVLTFVLIYLIYSRRKEKVDPLLGTYWLLCDRLASRGVFRDLHEGPLHLKRRAVGQFPREARVLGEIFDHLTRARYGQEVLEKSQLKELERQIRQLPLARDSELLSEKEVS